MRGNAKSLTNLAMQWERGTGREHPAPSYTPRSTIARARPIRYIHYRAVRLISSARDHISRSAGGSAESFPHEVFSLFPLFSLGERARPLRDGARERGRRPRDYASAGRNSGNEQKNSSRRPSSIISHVILELARTLTRGIFNVPTLNVNRRCCNVSRRGIKGQYFFWNRRFSTRFYSLRKPERNKGETRSISPRRVLLIPKSVLAEMKWRVRALFRTDLDFFPPSLVFTTFPYSTSDPAYLYIRPPVQDSSRAPPKTHT